MPLDCLFLVFVVSLIEECKYGNDLTSASRAAAGLLGSRGTGRDALVDFGDGTTHIGTE